MLRRPLQLLTLTLASLAVLAAPGAEAGEIIIDDFTDDLDATTSVASDSYSYVFDFHTIGIQPPGDGSIEIDDVPDALIVTNIGDDPFQGIVYWPLVPLSPGEDLYDGTNDQFEVAVGAVSGSWTAQMSVTQGLVTTFSTVKPLAADTLLFFTLGDFGGIDFTELFKQVSLTLTNTSGDMGDSARVFHVTAVPEPGTALMLGLGLIGIALQGRRHPIA